MQWNMSGQHHVPRSALFKDDSGAHAWLLCRWRMLMVRGCGRAWMLSQSVPTPMLKSLGRTASSHHPQQAKMPPQHMGRWALPLLPACLFICRAVLYCRAVAMHFDDVWCVLGPECVVCSMICTALGYNPGRASTSWLTAHPNFRAEQSGCGTGRRGHR